MKKKLIAGAATAALALCLTGCVTGGSPETDGRAGKQSPNLVERTITLTDGRTITCVVYKQGYAGGLSCDWGDR